MVKIPKKLVERILKEFGAKRVSLGAKELVIERVLEELEEVVGLAVRNARHFGRKLVTKEDIEFGFDGRG
jgi:histone H3/H4